MKGFVNWAYNASWFTLGIAVASVLLFGIVAVQASTTISANIETGGTLGVSGLSSLAGFQSTASSSVGAAFNVTGNSTLAGLISSASSTFTGALWASSTLQSTGAARFYADSTFDGGIDALTLTHTNAATSSITVGCVDTFATSTGSPIKLMFFASSTLGIDGASITAGFGGGTQQGLVLWGYGSCS